MVTANNGDTIYPTGNFYYATKSTDNGSTTHHHIDYGGIKISQNQSLCKDFLSATFTAESSFGSGSIQNRVAPAIVPGYTKINLGPNNPVDNLIPLLIIRVLTEQPITQDPTNQPQMPTVYLVAFGI